MVDDNASREEARRWIMTPSDREIHLPCSIQYKREIWFEMWRLCGRARESVDDGGAGK